MNKYPDSYRAAQCEKLATQIEEAVLRLEGPQYEDIKKKLLEYAAKKDQINVNTSLNNLMGIFQRQVGEIYEPEALSREIDSILEKCPAA